MVGIYQIFNTVSGKRYIGQSVHISARIAEHKCSLNKGAHPNKYLQRAWNQDGASAFQFSTLEQCSVGQLGEREKYWIAYYSTLDNSKGYNLVPGGALDAETRAKISQTLKGRKKPEGFGAKISAAQKGKRSKETVAAISDAVKDWWATATPEQKTARISHASEARLSNKKPFSEEQRKRCSEAQKRYWASLTPEELAVRRATAVRVQANLSPEQKEQKRLKISEANKARIYGPLSEEVKHKLSVALTGKPHPVDISPEATAKRSAAQTKVMSVPSRREHLREKAAAYYSDPVNRQKHKEACAAALERRRAQETVNYQLTKEEEQY